MVKSIFENKVVEGTDMGNKMRFPRDPNMSFLPPACSNKGEKLPVKDEKGTHWTLTCKDHSGKIHFTDGWTEFRKGRDIRVGHKISFYKDEDSIGSGAQYKIEVKKN